MNDSRPVMSRDASWFEYPDTSKPKKYHLPRNKTGVYGHYVAMCSERIILNEGSKIPAEAVQFILCKRCFPNNQTQIEE